MRVRDYRVTVNWETLINMSIAGFILILLPVIGMVSYRLFPQGPGPVHFRYIPDPNLLDYALFGVGYILVAVFIVALLFVIIGVPVVTMKALFDIEKLDSGKSGDSP